MKYTEIFEDIVSLLHKDYAGYLENNQQDKYKMYNQIIGRLEREKKLTDDQFHEIVEEYIVSKGDTHLNFSQKQASPLKYWSGFQVKRYQDALYVTAADQEEHIHVGEKIIALDGTAIPDIVKKCKPWLEEKTAERENWEKVLLKHRVCLIEDHNGEQSEMELQSYEKAPFEAEYTLSKINENTLLLKLTDFVNPAAVADLVRNNEQSLQKADALIIDVRVNNGGMDNAYFPLVPYLFKEDLDLFKNSEDDQMLLLHTERNYQLRHKLLQDAADKINDSESAKLLQLMLDELELNKGKGFIPFEPPINRENYYFPAKPGPKKVIVLADVTCGSSGDSFVELVKLSPKVTVLGRATKGMNDYANVAFMDYDDRFQLMYPTSKLRKVDKGEGMAGVGILPDIHIPWSPEHLKRDVDLEAAIAFLKQKQSVN